MMRTAELETILWDKLKSAGLESVLNEEKSQFLDTSDGFFAEIVLNDGSKLAAAKRIIRTVRQELKGAGVKLDSIVRAIWRVKEINLIGPARSVSGGLKSALEFEAVLESGSRECPVSVEVTLGALNTLREKLALFDNVGSPRWTRDGDADADTLRKVVKEFVALQLSFGGTSAWDPLLFPKLQVTEQAIAYLLPDSETYGRLKVAIDDFFDPRTIRLRLRAAERDSAKIGDFDRFLPELSEVLSGGAYQGGQNLWRDAESFYKSLGEVERRRLEHYYQSKVDRISQALRQEFPAVF
jgi:hypothetical protein